MVELEITHMIGAAIALMSFIVGRIELMNKCLHKLDKRLDTHIELAKFKENNDSSNAAI